MRLWHQWMLSALPSVKDGKGSTNQLGGQHTEVRMILGTIKKHGKVNHSTVNYINKHSVSHLRAYGLLVIDEMIKRGFNVSEDIIEEYTSDEEAVSMYNKAKNDDHIIYPEHDINYLGECLENLKQKNVIFYAS